MTGLTVYKDHMRHVSLEYNFDAGEIVCHAWNASTGLNRTSKNHIASQRNHKDFGLKTIATSAWYRLFVRDSRSGVEVEWLELGSCQTQELAALEMTGPVFGTFTHTTAIEGERTGVKFLDLKAENA